MQPNGGANTLEFHYRDLMIFSIAQLGREAGKLGSWLLLPQPESGTPHHSYKQPRAVTYPCFVSGRLGMVGGEMVHPGSINIIFYIPSFWSLLEILLVFIIVIVVVIVYSQSCSHCNIRCYRKSAQKWNWDIWNLSKKMSTL